VASLTDDVLAGSEWISQALRSSGYLADFSPASLWSVDRFLDDHAPAGQPRRGGLLATDVGSRLFSLGAYTGEVLRRNLGGQWQTNDADPEGELNVALTLPVGDVVFPVQRVMKRFKNGTEDSVAAYGAALGLVVGPDPKPARRRRFGR